MEKLEIKHLAPYLAYGLKLWHTDWECQLTMDALGSGCNYFSIEDVNDYAKPILRPLSDLTKEIEHNGEKFVPSLKLDMIRKDICVYQYINPDYPIEITIQTENYSQEVDLLDGYLVMQKLFEWHFDVFGLIEKGLAVNKNEI